MADVSDELLDELYAVPPDDFLAKRAEVADQVPDPASAQAIRKLRKPTVGAWLVNALVIDDPSVVESLSDLGERLRAAQDALDAGKLRELSTQRRELVGRLTAQAFRQAGRKQPPAAQRDEVTGTFDAAIADAEVAGRLGRLQRPEQWSGFGFDTAGPPELTLVRGGKDGRAAKPKREPKVSAVRRRQLQRTLDTARDAFADAEAALEQAQDGERELADRVRALTRKLAAVQGQLDDARGELEAARKDVATARTRRREARSALDRAERAGS